MKVSLEVNEVEASGFISIESMHPDDFYGVSQVCSLP